jgi:hypothetical protein
MNTQTAILEKSYHSLTNQFQRIVRLLSIGPDNPLGEHFTTIGGKFSQSDATVRNLFIDMRRAIDEKRYDVAWEKAIKLQTDDIPLLASELLAVIGGLYLIDGLVSSGWRDSPDQKEYNAFATTASELISDLKTRSGGEWRSILIVGEERVGYTEAEIIRLRFPACDLWHLPFTAHEYGWLVAKLRPPEEFAKLRDRVGTTVHAQVESADNGSDKEAPPDAACYLPAVHALWKEYRNATGGEKDTFAEIHDARLKRLAERQKDHLCRLFADAFATLFAGPAYLYALLYLRLLPNASLTQPEAHMPAFVERFVFSLETLRWMNNHPGELWKRRLPGVDVSESERPFHEELNATSGIPRLWQDTLVAAGVESLDEQSRKSLYDQAKERMQPWLSDIIKGLNKKWSSGNALGGTYNAWRDVYREPGKETLTEALESDTDKIYVDKFPDYWSVLNAAWKAYHSSPLKEHIIEKKALQLLGREPDVLRARASRGSQMGLPAGGRPPQTDFDIVLQGLAQTREFALLKRFREWNDAGRASISDDLDAEILGAIGANDRALSAYLVVTGRQT